jgi:hypothetical protein
MVFNATFNNISVISRRSVEETGVPGAASHWQTLSHNVASSTPHHERDSNSQLLVVISTDGIGSCKSNCLTSYDHFFNTYCLVFFDSVLFTFYQKMKTEVLQYYEKFHYIWLFTWLTEFFKTKSSYMLKSNTTKEFSIAFYVKLKKISFHTGFILSLI